MRGNLTNKGENHSARLQWCLNLLQGGLDVEKVPFCSTVSGKSALTRKAFIEACFTLAGIEATTIYYPDQDGAAVPEGQAKKFRSVKSSNHSITPAPSTTSNAQGEQGQASSSTSNQHGRGRKNETGTSMFLIVTWFCISICV